MTIEATSSGAVSAGQHTDGATLMAEIYTVLIEKSHLVSGDLHEKINQIKANNERIRQSMDSKLALKEALNESEGIMVDEATWAVEGNTIHLDNGYEISLSNTRQEWIIKDASGNQTRIWGDPHVDEGDTAGNREWDFWKQSTFVLNDGTKITVGTAPWGNRGATVSESLTITKGNQQVQVTGIANNNVQIGQVNLNAITDGTDDNTNDGHVFREGPNGVDDWLDSSGNEIKSNQATEVIDNEVSGAEDNIRGVSEELKTFMDENNITHDFVAGQKLTPAQWSNLIEKLETFKEGLSQTGSLETIKMQQVNSILKQTQEQLSNMVAKEGQSLGTVTGNMR